MKASAGDRIRFGNTDHPDRRGEIVQVRGRERGEPPFLIRYDSGAVRLVIPGPDAVLEPRSLAELDA